MKCATLTTVYSCNSASGTSCIKVTSILPVVNANTTCAAADYVLLLKPEYDTLVTNTATAQTTATNANSTANTANTAATNAQSATSGISAIQADVNLLKAWSGVGASVPNTDVLQAESLLFAAIFTSAVIVWGVKRVFNLFNTQSHE